MKFIGAAFAITLLFAGAIGLRADTPGKHPYYLHALSDLRAAKWNIEHRPGDFQVSEDEVAAVNEIKAVIGDIKKASIDDGKDIDDHPAVDEKLDYKGHLHHAYALLKKTHSDLAREEDDASVRGLRNRSIKHLDKAIRFVGKAIKTAERHHD